MDQRESKILSLPIIKNKMNKQPIIFCLLLVFAGLLISCSEYSKILKSDDQDLRLRKAIEYYESGECYKALPLFEELLGIKKGTDQADSVYYYYAQVHYCLRQNYLANYYFKTFTKNYPNSPFVEECQFMAAMCSYRNSPKYSLDQRQSQLAIEEFQLFINKYPNSSLKDSCNAMIEELHSKIEFKDYEIATLYHKTEKYKAAIVALNNFLQKYPLSKHREEILFLLPESHFLYAENSVEEKKIERYNNCIESYYNFVAAFPESKKKRTAEGYFEKSMSYIESNK